MFYPKAAGRLLRALWREVRLYSTYTLGGKMVIVGVVLAIFQNMLCGLYPCYFSMKRRRLIISKMLATYALIFGTLFGVFYVSSLWKDYIDQQIDQRDVIQFYCYLNIGVCLLNYIEQWATLAEVIKFQNSVQLFKTINSFTVPLGSTKQAVILLVFKAIACPCLVFVTLIIYFKRSEPESVWKNTFKTMLPIFIANLINNCFFGSVVITKALLGEINLCIHEILKEINRLQTAKEMKLHKPYYRMLRFCELSERLDKLAVNYAMTTRSSMGYLKYTAFSLVTSLTINLVTSTLGFYTQYQAITDYIMLEEPYDLFRALVHLVFVLVPYLEILFVARGSQQVLDEAKETGNLLQRMDLKHADVRFKQSVDAFWLKVCTIKYKLVPMGLFELNESMVNKIFSTVAGFLLFLIQNDLTLRFTLK